MRHLTSLILALGFVGVGAAGMFFFFAAGWNAWTITVAGAVLVFSALWLYAVLGMEKPFERNSDALPRWEKTGVAANRLDQALATQGIVFMERRKYRRRTDERTKHSRKPLLIALILAMLAVIIVAAFKLSPP